MKAKHLLISFLTTVCMLWGGLVFADDVAPIDSMQVQTTVNINEADAETLAEVLDGVGISRAEAIVEYREKNGKFYSAEELSAVRGIGMTTVAKNEAKIVVK
jgi:competence protein ComEA